MCISDFGDGGGGGGGSSLEAQFNEILHLNGTLFTQPTALLLCRGTLPFPSSFLLPTTCFRTRRHFLRLLSSVSPVPRSYSAYKSLPDGENWISQGHTCNYNLAAHLVRSYHGLTTGLTIVPLLLLSLDLRARTGPSVIAVIFPILISCKTFQLWSSSTSQMVVLFLFLSFFFIFFFYSLSVKWICTRAKRRWQNRSGNIRNIGRVYFSLQSHPVRNASEGWFRIYMSRGTLSGFQPCLWSAFKNNEDHFLCPVIFFLSDLPASSSFPLLPDLSLDVAVLIYFPWD